MNRKQEALGLYRIAFPKDPMDFAVEFIDQFFDSNCLTDVRDGRLACMLFLFECSIRLEGAVYPAYYVYAVATHPDYRGRGYMRALMERAKEKARRDGRAALLIKPSNEQLYSFYEKLGFHTACFYNEGRIVCSHEAIRPIRQLSAEDYGKARERLLDGRDHVCWDEMFDYITQDAVLLGGDTFCACAEIYNGKLFVREFLSADGSGKDSILAFFSLEEGVFRTAEPVVPFGMLCPLSETVAEIDRSLYMGFAMD